MAKVLVTGGAGFIGHSVVAELLSMGHEVRVADNLSKGLNTELDMGRIDFRQVDLLDMAAAESALEGIEYCFHFAARIGGIGYFHRYPAAILRDNTLMTFNLLDGARKTEAFRKMIYISSSMVFERTAHFPSKEEDIFSSPPPITQYGFSKLVGEYQCRAYNEQYGMKYAIFRPFNAYGPGEAPEDEGGYAHVIPDLVKKMFIDRQYPVKIMGDGSQVRAYTYATDIAYAVSHFGMEQKSDNEDFNVANPAAHTVSDIATRIWAMRDMGKPLHFEYVKSFKDDVQKRVPDASKIRGVFGWEAKVGLDEGLKNTVEWILANYKHKPKNP